MAEVEVQVFGGGTLFAGKTAAYVMKPTGQAPMRVNSTDVGLKDGEQDPVGAVILRLASEAGRRSPRSLSARSRAASASVTTAGRFAPGDVLVRREILRGEVWFGCPTICVEDSPDLLALFLPTAPSSVSRVGEVSVRAAPVAARRAHRLDGARQADAATARRGALGRRVLVRPAAHLRRWYFNLQDPFRRTPIGVDTLDHELDLWWAADADRYVFKDVEMFAQRLVEGRYPGQGEAIRAEGDRIAALLDAGERWWDESWSTWQPDPAWPVPHLPTNWAAIPPQR